MRTNRQGLGARAFWRFVVHVLALLFVFYVVWNVRSGVLAAAIIMALILAFINTILRPILILLTLPVTILTLGLFILILNALLFALALGILGALGFAIHLGFGQVVVGWLIYVVISWGLNRLL